MEGSELTDRRLEALLARLDRIATQLERLNRRQESREDLAVIAHELRNLNESMQAIAYAALGQQGPQVRRRRLVRGVALATEELPLDRWLDELAAALLAEARRSEQDRLALERLLAG